MRETTDILISGGGVAGLAAACAFGNAGFRVTCVEPNPPVTTAADEGSDLRTTAFLHPSIPVLEKAGLWVRLEPHAAALRIMRIVDAGGEVVVVAEHHGPPGVHEQVLLGGGRLDHRTVGGEVAAQHRESAALDQRADAKIPSNKIRFFIGTPS